MALARSFTSRGGSGLAGTFCPYPVSPCVRRVQTESSIIRNFFIAVLSPEYNVVGQFIFIGVLIIGEMHAQGLPYFFHDPAQSSSIVGFIKMREDQSDLF